MADKRPLQGDRPVARYSSRFEKPPEDPFQMTGHEKDTRRRQLEARETRRSRLDRRKEHQQGRVNSQRAGLGRIICFAFFAILLLAFSLSFRSYFKAQAQLRALRDERQAQIDKHERELGYYVQMRKVSGYDEYIRQYAQEFQVDRSFISAIIARESSYDPKAESRVGARGLMQIMQDSGEWISGRLAVRPYSYELLFEPALNIRFGAWYLNYLSSHFNGNPVMIASAYHAGASNVKQWAMKYAQDRRTLSVDQIPTEDTRDYVQKVMNAYALFYEYDSTH